MITRDRIYLAYRSADGAPTESSQLERDGYAVIRSAFSPSQISELTEEIDRVFSEWPRDNRAGDMRSAEEDNMFRYEMLNRSSVCMKATGDRGILDAIEPLLGENCHVIANTAWRNEPNFEAHHGGGFWHIDAGPHIPLPPNVKWPENIPHPVFAIGAHIFLKDCDADDGPTGVIPGSHLSGQVPPRNADENLTFNNVSPIPLIAKAGDVALFVSDVWHRRLPTGPGDRGRYFLQVHYGRRDIAQRIRTTETVNHLAPNALQHVTTARERELLGLHPANFYDG